MIFEIFVMLFLIGIMLNGMDMVIPMTSQNMPLIALGKFFGNILLILGFVVITARLMQTDASKLLDFPSNGVVKLFHQRRGRNPNTRIMNGKLTDLEFIRAKNKLFKDTGGGFRLAGHDCRRTHEIICHDIPEWVSQYFYDIKKRYGVKNLEQFHELRKALQSLQPEYTAKVMDGKLGFEVSQKVTLEMQLKDIEFLEPIMKDPVKKKELLKLNIDQLKSMSEVFFDGVTHHGEEVEQFFESVTPNELDALEKQQYLNDTMRERNYRDTMQYDWTKYAAPVFWILLGLGIAYVLLKGVS